ncbi:MAG: Aminodeoxychorismate lyase [Candidatus Woesebacteria bacterium GW2011_GWA2_40_7]|uniref:Endolytic murein transglycosylase n=3 Tax=Candidatus Woeseibacteriota TaxID=1752722 RepID=A0A0G0LLR5_9BACT|nr:MAG: Aminodeoxychorismate lyase [Candidatus Woesebacteria bacterium GW2011_GWB1_39_10]KKR73797.1 MAG: Aminodeoxychorismate lyase [Candidatus Woesebacteria bacterium GW2011_GWA2_40_7]KKS90942.1 MAG: Aminodeoxychorismate lyase [Candidatus Woesebacteria bacterium GW2011_GWA1_43_12]
MKKLLAVFIVLIFLVSTSLIWFNYFDSPGNSTQTQVFVIPQDQIDFDIAQELRKEGLIKNAKGLNFLMDTFALGKFVAPGGYKLSRNMNAWQVMKKITSKEDLSWVTISFCPRKEQVGEKLAKALDWNSETLEKWNTVYTNTKPEYFEGVYYPDTYLIPRDENGAQIANRFISHFNEKFAPFTSSANEKNIKWTTVLKIASLIAREAGGKEDMKVISGIIWNRLNKNMALQIDATMQYTLGKNENGSWWGNIDLSQKRKDSPYNSYLYKGLPPTPICSPNIDAIDAALNPEETDCLFYLHDTNKQIHCAETYTEHKANIEKYLRI